MTLINDVTCKPPENLGLKCLKSNILRFLRVSGYSTNKKRVKAALIKKESLLWTEVSRSRFPSCTVHSCYCSFQTPSDVRVSVVMFLTERCGETWNIDLLICKCCFWTLGAASRVGNAKNPKLWAAIFFFPVSCRRPVGWGCVLFFSVLMCF